MTFSEPLKWLGVDFDGTLFESLWSIDNPTSDIGEPIWANVIKAKLAYQAGYKIIVHTARPSTDYAAIEAALNEYEIPFKFITTGKILVASYVDDRGVHESAPSWNPKDGYHCGSCTCNQASAKGGS